MRRGERDLILRRRRADFSINRVDSVVAIFANIAGIQICAPPKVVGSPYMQFRRKPLSEATAETQSYERGVGHSRLVYRIRMIRLGLSPIGGHPDRRVPCMADILQLPNR